MTAPAFLMKGHQQGHWNVFVEFLFVTGGALAAFTEVSVGENIKIMMADPATQNGFVQIVIKPHRRLKMFFEPFAFQVHDPFLGFFLGPC
jgi:hypothetical protein